jgi:release factor glutamine methyltransferase
MTSMRPTIKYIKENLSRLYEQSEIDSFCFLIINYLLGFSKSELILNQEYTLSGPDVEKVRQITSRLKGFEPIQYIIGSTEFYGLTFLVGPGVLIPRFETEELVDLIIKDNSEKKVLKILDIGSGSGCIAISLKRNLHEAEVWCCDISDKALELTRKNAGINSAQINIEKFDILSNSTFNANGFSIIVSNPPYITWKEKEVMPRNVLDHEPELALFVPDNDPLLFYRAIVEKSICLLAPDGKLYLEINEAYGPDVKALLAQHQFEASILKDINSKNRMVRACRM